MTAEKTVMFKQPGSVNYMAQDFLSSGMEIEIFRDADEKSPHFDQWVFTKNGVFQDCDASILSLADRNNLSIDREGLMTACLVELESLQRYNIYCTLDTPFTEEDPSGGYIKHDDIVDLINRFKNTL